MNFKKITSVTAIAVLVAMTGACSSTGSKVATSDVEDRLKAVQEREAELATKEAQLAAREASAASVSTESSASTVAAGDALLPPYAKPGECYARIFIPAEFKTVTEQKLKKGSEERVEIIPAKYATVTERVLVEEESERLEVIPATYKTVTERVLVKPEAKKLVAVPAKYENQTERVLVREAYTTWTKGTGPIQRIDESTGEIMCLVEVPAEYKTITKRVMVTPPSTQEIAIPEEYSTVTKRVVDQAASTRTVKIPAKYKTVNITKMVEPPQERRLTTPEEFQTVTKTVKVGEGRMEWREILCDTNMTRGRITELQRALAAKGFNPGPIDGVVGWETMAAMNKFQKSVGLPVSRYISVKDVEALGVNPG